MSDATAEEESGPIGVNPPDHRPDVKSWTLRRHDFEVHRGSDLQPRRGSHLCSEPTDIHGAREVAGSAGVDHDRPGDTSAGILPPVLRLRGMHGEASWQLLYQPPNPVNSMG